MSTPTYGFPFPTLGDVPNVPADIQALAEAVDTALAAEGEVQRRGTFTGTTDSTNGILTVTAAQLGLASATGAVASVQFTPSGGDPMLCAARVSGGNVQIIVFGVNPLTNGTLTRLTSTQVTVHVVAWGAAA